MYTWRIYCSHIAVQVWSDWKWKLHRYLYKHLNRLERCENYTWMSLLSNAWIDVRNAVNLRSVTGECHSWVAITFHIFRCQCENSLTLEVWNRWMVFFTTVLMQHQHHFGRSKGAAEMCTSNSIFMQHSEKIYQMMDCISTFRVSALLSGKSWIHHCCNSEWSQKYRSTNVYTSNYIRHHTVQCERICQLPLKQSRPTSRVAHRFGSDKLYICLSNKCFNCIQCICCVTDVRP